MALSLQLLSGLDQVDAAQWDALVGDDNPFVEYAFLRALEVSGCVGPQAGWIPCHLALRDGAGVLRGAMPLYHKDNSFGEYIFDWAWADAAARAGLDYYPKLVSAVPFTSVTGPRLLVHPAADPELVTDQLLAAVKETARATGANSIHLLFCRAAERDAAARHGLLPRASYQFHWHNRGWDDFEQLLCAFRHSARKNVRRERRRAASQDITLQTLRGEALDDDQWRALYRFYQDTSSRKWGQAYLNAAFFRQAQQTLAHRVVVTLASRQGQPVAGALSFHKGRRLYGRYWGSLEAFHSLHFELCYYRPLELCLQQGWDRFEAGAQGVHKLKRGLLPAATHSAHWFAHPGLHQAVQGFIRSERREVQQEMAALARHSPYREQRRAATG